MKRAVVGILSLLSTYPSCTAAYTATLRAPSVAFSLHLAGARLGLRLQMQGPILDASRSMNPERPEGAKRFAPAAQRNTPPILAVRWGGQERERLISQTTCLLQSTGVCVMSERVF